MRKRQWKQTVGLAMASVLLASGMTGCGNKAETAQTQAKTDTQAAPAETSQEAEAPEMDLGGMEIIIGDWWSSGEPAVPTSAQEEATLEYRNMIQEKYNFTIKEMGLGDWDSHQETFTMSTMAEDPAAQIFLMDPAMIAQPMANGLFYDLASLDSIDVTDSKWNEAVTTLMTKKDCVYGLKAGSAEPRLGVFWNKRMFREAGLSPDLPYDLQASGDWTWEEFEELCEKLTIDTDNDGTTDSYAMASFSLDLYSAAVLSNEAEWIGMDDDGKYVSRASDPKLLEAMQWVTGMIDRGYEMRPDETADWDWFMSAFPDGKVAMTVAEEHKVSYWKEMEDEFGFVMFPKGPKAKDYVTNVNENVVVIPACYDKETAEKIAFAYNMYTEKTPGYEADDDWKSIYYSGFCDERAVDETLELMRDPNRQRIQYISVIYGIERGDIVYNVYGGWNTPAEMIEQVSGVWEAALAEANKNQ